MPTFKKNRKNFIISGLVILSLLGLICYILLRDQPGNSVSDAKTTSLLGSAQQDFTDANSDKAVGNTINENQGDAMVKDTRGQAKLPTNTSPTVSKTGEISVYSPSPNGLVRPGYELTGTSTLSSVSYRIIDSISGVIASGELTVIGGKFSGQLSFDTAANEGRIDLFSVRVDGSEFGNVEIPVRFK